MTVEERDRNVSRPAPLREMFHLEHFSRFYKMYVPVSILMGVVCGLSMVAFHLLIVTSTHMLSWIPIYIAPLIGGILSGGFIYLGVREIEGSGISKAIELTHDPGELHTRTVLTKMVASSVSIGSGNRCPKLVQSWTSMSLTDVRFLLHRGCFLLILKN